MMKVEVRIECSKAHGCGDLGGGGTARRLVVPTKLSQIRSMGVKSNCLFGQDVDCDRGGD
jgi:hypothetical protein